MLCYFRGGQFALPIAGAVEEDWHRMPPQAAGGNPCLSQHIGIFTVTFIGRFYGSCQRAGNCTAVCATALIAEIPLFASFSAAAPLSACRGSRPRAHRGWAQIIQRHYASVSLAAACFNRRARALT
jgi:hypothetical protein